MSNALSGTCFEEKIHLTDTDIINIQIDDDIIHKDEIHIQIKNTTNIKQYISYINNISKDIDT